MDYGWQTELALRCALNVRQKHVFAAAVCDFCRKKESELYQKEVSKIISYPVFFTIGCLGILQTPLTLCYVFYCNCSHVKDLSPEHTGGAFLSPVDSMSALPGLPPRGRALHKVREPQHSISSLAPDLTPLTLHHLLSPPTVGTVPSFT